MTNVYKYVSDTYKRNILKFIIKDYLYLDYNLVI